MLVKFVAAWRKEREEKKNFKQQDVVAMPYLIFIYVCSNQ